MIQMQNLCKLRIFRISPQRHRLKSVAEIENMLKHVVSYPGQRVLTRFFSQSMNSFIGEDALHSFDINFANVL